MLEVTANAPQTVDANKDVIFTAAPVKVGCTELIRDDSGLVTLKGGNLYKVGFGANIGVPATGTAGEVGVAPAIDGEAILTSQMIQTTQPGELGNVYCELFVRVPKCCCYVLSVQNTTTNQAVAVKNANLIVERVA